MTQNEMLVAVAVGTCILKGRATIPMFGGGEIILEMDGGEVRCNVWPLAYTMGTVAGALLAYLDAAPRPSGADGRPLYTWTVQVGVSETWVADGLDLDDERLGDILSAHLGWATSAEYTGKVIAAPPRRDILTAQGYPDGYTEEVK